MVSKIDRALESSIVSRFSCECMRKINYCLRRFFGREQRSIQLRKTLCPNRDYRAQTRLIKNVVAAISGEYQEEKQEKGEKDRGKKFVTINTCMFDIYQLFDNEPASRICRTISIFNKENGIVIHNQ